MTTNRNWLWLVVWLGVIGIALALRTVNLDFGLPQRLHPDEWSQVEVAWRMANGDWNPHFFRYPAGQMSLLAGVYRFWSLFYKPTLSDLYLLGRYVSVLLGVLGVGLVVLWAARVWRNPWAGLVAGLLAAFNWTLVEQSHYAIVDVPLMFWCGLTLFALSETHRQDRWLALAAIGIGFALSSKYTAILLLVPYFLVNWFSNASMPAISSRRRSLWIGLLVGLGLTCMGVSLAFSVWRNEILHWAASLSSDGHLEREYLHLYLQMSLLLMLAGLLLFSLAFALWRWPAWQGWTRIFQPKPFLFLLFALAIFVALSPFTLIEWRQGAQNFFYEYRHMQMGSAAQYAQGSLVPGQLKNIAGTSSLNDYLLLFVSEWGWLVLALAGLGSLRLVQMRPELGIALLVYLISYGWIIGGWGNYAARYAILFSLPLAMLTGGGFLLCRRWLARVLAGWSVPAMFLMLLLTLWTPLRSTFSGLKVFSLPDTRQIAYAWILKNIPADAYLAYDYAPDLLAQPHSFRLLGVSSFVLCEYSSPELRAAGVDFVITNFDPQDPSLSPLVDRDVWQEFVHDYQLVQSFPARPGRSRGRDIWVYREKGSG